MSDFKADVLPQTPLGEIQRSPDPLAGFYEPTSKRRGRERRGGSRGVTRVTRRGSLFHVIIMRVT